MYPSPSLRTHLFERLLVIVERHPPVGQLEALQLPEAGGQQLEEGQQGFVVDNQRDGVGVDVSPV